MARLVELRFEEGGYGEILGMLVRMEHGKMYEASEVQALFDEMAATYGRVNLISSFGFNERWRRQCVQAIEIGAGERVLDMMTGMGELLAGLSERVGEGGSVTGVDFSPVMCGFARRSVEGIGRRGVDVVEGDMLSVELAGGPFDVVVSSFGLKTFSDGQRRELARRVYELLRPGGRLSFVEISVPAARWLCWPYMFYVRRVIPWVGALLLGNPDNYRMLGVYTSAFGNCDETCAIFREAGLEVTMASYFFGCATGIVGCRPR